MNDKQQDVLHRSDRSFPADDIEPAQRPVHVVFPDSHAAEFLVAGLPAAVRVLLAITETSPGAAITCAVASGRWTPSRRCLDECARLCGTASVQLGAGQPAPQNSVAVDAMEVLDRITREAERPGVGERSAKAAGRNPYQALRHASEVFLKATAKPQDGLVSRYLNRPVSRVITRAVLRIAAARPVHATAGTALLAILMLTAMLAWPAHGAVLGALLYQAASIFDGVDGEMARATYRTSHAGAKLDSLIDAATNLTFFAGLSTNLYLSGDSDAAFAGWAGMLILLGGLSQIGLRAHQLGQPINFEAVKVYLRRGRSSSWLTDILIWITMRDFIAFAIAVVALAGFARLVPFIFLVCAVCWFAVISVILLKSGKTAS
jgi:CDP-L-myo-inositol myo-inositolphosphotransferase